MLQIIGSERFHKALNEAMGLRDVGLKLWYLLVKEISTFCKLPADCLREYHARSFQTSRLVILLS